MESEPKTLPILTIIAFCLWFWSIIFAWLGVIDRVPFYIFTALFLILAFCMYMQEKESPRRDSSKW